MTPLYREKSDLYCEAWKLAPEYIIRHKHILSATKSELVVSPTGMFGIYGLVSPTRDATDLDLQKLVRLIFEADFIKVDARTRK
jgi:hypothetical protein